MNLPLVQFRQTSQRGLITARICSLWEGNVSVVSVGGSPMLALRTCSNLFTWEPHHPAPALLPMWGPTLHSTPWTCSTLLTWDRPTGPVVKWAVDFRLKGFERPSCFSKVTCFTYSYSTECERSAVLSHTKAETLSATFRIVLV